MRWQEPFGSGRPGDEQRRAEREREGRIEAAIRQSERARVAAWLRALPGRGPLKDSIALADAIERGEHWREA